jgi:hypothetical protein
MNEKIGMIRKTRVFLLEGIKDLTNEQLNTVPPGFNNNIVWNLGHLVAAQQGICYSRAGLKTWVPEDFFNSYRPGSKPEGKVNEEEIKKIKELFFTSLDILEQDYEKGLWTSYPAWSTRYGIELNSIDKAIEFLHFHEGLHSGYIFTMKRIV